MIAKLQQWNEQLNGLPRKLLLVGVTFLLAAAVLQLLPYAWPFAVAFCLSRLLEPFVRLMYVKMTRIPEARRRGIAALIGMLVLFGLAGAAVTALVSFL